MSFERLAGLTVEHWMGLVALGALWLNTLLVALAALSQAARVVRLRAALRSCLEAEALDEVAAHVTEQVGRRAGDDPSGHTVVFHDRALRSELLGGRVLVGADECTLSKGGELQVWVPLAARRAVASCPSAHAFDTTMKEAARARGWSRSVRASIGAGARVWIGATREQASLVPGPAGSLLVSAIDPRPLLAGHATRLVAFAIASVGGAGFVTWLALVPPVFGFWSTVGGALGLAFFLAVQPAGTATRDAALLPHEAPLGGQWKRPS